ncbi:MULTISPECIES: phosphotransferase [unclassified Streptomyces]|uniref:phosphotransferase n=1 Tax=unclassified Streptomyces TaxID=2593676 RepID=UPI00168A9D6D|nr:MULTISPECIES: phosphotransferase [unclassified Streptomyces]MBD3007349.1 phosphotransferase [Streptomyces sp. 5-10]
MSVAREAAGWHIETGGWHIEAAGRDIETGGRDIAAAGQHMDDGVRCRLAGGETNGKVRHDR